MFGRKNRDDLWRVQRFRMPEPLVEVAPLAAPTGNEGFFAAIDRRLAELSKWIDEQWLLSCSLAVVLTAWIVSKFVVS